MIDIQQTREQKVMEWLRDDLSFFIASILFTEACERLGPEFGHETIKAWKERMDAKTKSDLSKYDNSDLMSKMLGLPDKEEIEGTYQDCRNQILQSFNSIANRFKEY